MNLNEQELIEIRQDEQLDLNNLRSYLKDILNMQFKDIETLQFSGGHANLTYLLKIDDIEYVLRRPPLGPIAPSSHDMFREHTVQSKINTKFSLAPKSLYFCDDESVIGSKFHIIERRNGFVIRKKMEPFITQSRENIRKLSFRIIDVLADLHKVDFELVGLGNLGRPEGFVKRQLGPATSLPEYQA